MPVYNLDCVEIEYNTTLCGILDIKQTFAPTPKRKTISKDVRNYIYNRDNHTCKICGRYMPNGYCIENNEVIKINIDHILAVQNGGDNSIDNLQVLCEKCNRMKGTKPMSVFENWGKVEIAF